MTSFLRKDSAISGIKDLNQHIPVDLSEKYTSSLTISSVAKAALVVFTTIGSYYFAKTANIFGWGSKNPKDVTGKEIVKVRNEEQSLMVKTNLEGEEQTKGLFATRSLQSYGDEIVEFEEMKIQELKTQKMKFQEFEDLPEVERREETRRSITLQSSMSNQTATVGKLFELIINGASIFNSNTVFINATNIPSWLTSFSLPLTLKGSCCLRSSISEIAVSGNYAYVGSSYGLKIIDITDPENPTVKSSYGKKEIGGIALSGNYAYVIDYRNSSLKILDITDPENPIFKSSYATPDKAYGIALSGDYAYVTDYMDPSLQIINITDPANPTFKGSLEMPSNSYGIAVSGNYAYVGTYNTGLQIINITDPANPTFTSSYGIPDWFIDVAISENYAYLAADNAGLQIIDITDPENPIFTSSHDTHDRVVDIAISGNYAYLTDYPSGLQIIDVTDPENPTLKASYDIVYTGAIALSGNYAYVEIYDSLQIMSTNFDKLNISGIPTSEGIYSVEIRGCNEINECITDNFNIIVKNASIDLNDFSNLNLIIISSIAACAGTLCIIGTCGSIIGGTISLQHRKKVKNQQAVEIETPLDAMSTDLEIKNTSQ